MEQIGEGKGCELAGVQGLEMESATHQGVIQWGHCKGGLRWKGEEML